MRAERRGGGERRKKHFTRTNVWSVVNECYKNCDQRKWKMWDSLESLWIINSIMILVFLVLPFRLQPHRQSLHLTQCSSCWAPAGDDKLCVCELSKTQSSSNFHSNMCFMTLSVAECCRAIRQMWVRGSQGLPIDPDLFRESKCISNDQNNNSKWGNYWLIPQTECQASADNSNH